MGSFIEFYDNKDKNVLTTTIIFHTRNMAIYKSSTLNKTKCYIFNTIKHFCVANKIFGYNYR